MDKRPSRVVGGGGAAKDEGRKKRKERVTERKEREKE